VDGSSPEPSAACDSKKASANFIDRTLCRRSARSGVAPSRARLPFGEYGSAPVAEAATRALPPDRMPAPSPLFERRPRSSRISRSPGKHARARRRFAVGRKKRLPPAAAASKQGDTRLARFRLRQRSKDPLRPLRSTPPATRTMMSASSRRRSRRRPPRVTRARSRRRARGSLRVRPLERAAFVAAGDVAAIRTSAGDGYPATDSTTPLPQRRRTGQRALDRFPPSLSSACRRSTGAEAACSIFDLSRLGWSGLAILAWVCRRCCGRFAGSECGHPFYLAGFGRRESDARRMLFCDAPNFTGSLRLLSCISPAADLIFLLVAADFGGRSQRCRRFCRIHLNERCMRSRCGV